MEKIQRAINQIEAMRDLASELAKDHPETGAWKNQTLAFDAALIVLRRFLEPANPSEGVYIPIDNGITPIPPGAE